MSLLVAGDIVIGYTVVLLSTVLGAVASRITEATPGYIPAVLSSMIVLVAFEVLNNIAVSVK